SRDEVPGVSAAGGSFQASLTSCRKYPVGGLVRACNEFLARLASSCFGESGRTSVSIKANALTRNFSWERSRDKTEGPGSGLGGGGFPRLTFAPVFSDLQLRLSSSKTRSFSSCSKVCASARRFSAASRALA